MGKRKRGRSVRKNTTGGSKAEEDTLICEAPHSFVIHRGKSIGKYIQELTSDFRKVMEPYTASNIKVRSKNVIKDFISVAGALKVSHLVMFTRTEKGPYVKMGRFPRGPTLTFKIVDYTLSRDVRSSLKRQITYEKQYANHALLILNNFSGKNSVSSNEGVGKALNSNQINLLSSMFQNMFPNINVTKVKLNGIRRCVLLNYDSETGLIEFRHYTLKVVPVGLSRGVKKIVADSKVPNLSRYENISEYLECPGGPASESEAEVDDASIVHLPQGLSSRGNMKNEKSSIKLVELGPRLTLEPYKIEDGLLDGEILYHKIMEKTEEEKEIIRQARTLKSKEKNERKRIQESNVKRKEREREKQKDKSIEGMKKIKRNDLPEGFKNAPDSNSDDDDDAEWYRREVGENPDTELFDQTSSSFSTRGGHKRFKKSRSDSFRSRNNSSKERSNSVRGRNNFSRERSESVGGRKKFSRDRSESVGGGKKSSRGKSDFVRGGKRSDSIRGRKNKRPTDTFNNQGVGPNYNKNVPNKGPKVTSAKKFKRK